ncbi:uncharacterized protein LOC129301854 [Prosopis cineraria]|uniref:uncharacterized protein LOC129301854 n=1 Tax=Prosopis cineraria TaxID=364024 RepID=UPI00240F8824|nr:uncharacterized protein LOC129301854 [Prosopis cineraria]
MQRIRKATHSGSWYTHNPKELSEQLEGWMRSSGATKSPKARAVIAPHAGYTYAGRTAASAFASIHPSNIRRVFVLGPSHHYFTEQCALSTATLYNTPFGDLPLDLQVNEELRATGKFQLMNMNIDETEHSLEMLMPFLAKVFEGHQIKIVPILVGCLSAEDEAMYGHTLAKYADDPNNFFCVSSDFCHWGIRFDYTYYDKEHGPIYKSIEALDKKGMEAIETGGPDAFLQYRMQYDNTICGRYAIAVYLNMLKSCESRVKIEFLQYEQSGQCRSLWDSSVSYASAVAMIDDSTSA